LKTLSQRLQDMYLQEVQPSLQSSSENRLYNYLKEHTQNLQNLQNWYLNTSVDINLRRERVKQLLSSVTTQFEENMSIANSYFRMSVSQIFLRYHLFNIARGRLSKREMKKNAAIAIVLGMNTMCF